jgi:hypothetical protein
MRSPSVAPARAPIKNEKVAEPDSAYAQKEKKEPASIMPSKPIFITPDLCEISSPVLANTNGHAIMIVASSRSASNRFI